jgi:hypothetical protein
MSKIASGQPGVVGNLIAAADLDQEIFVGFDGNICAAGAKAAGISMARYDEDEVAAIVKTGSWPVQVGGTISAAGVAIASDEDGYAVEADTPAGTTEITGADLIEINGYAGGVDPSVYPITSGTVLVDFK